VKVFTRFGRQSVGVSVPSESTLHYLMNEQTLENSFLVQEVTLNTTCSFRRSCLVTCLKQYVVMRLIKCQLTRGMVLLKQTNILVNR
jgi:hypothetical protein